MRIRDYLINRTDEFSLDDSRLYEKFFQRECNVGLMILGSGAFLYDKISDNANYFLMSSAVILATDITIRALIGNHGEKPASGLIGLLRNLSPKKAIDIFNHTKY